METVEVSADVIADTLSTSKEAQQAMSAATAELDRRQVVIDQYRRRTAEHEHLISRVYLLLNAEKTDDALDIVRAEYVAIHGPSDGNAG